MIVKKLLKHISTKNKLTLNVYNQKFHFQSQLKEKKLAENNYKIIDHCFDVVIVGAGGAGLRAALGLGSKGYQVAVVSKLHPLRSHTIAAQGGINATLDTSKYDNWSYHMYDTVKASDWLGDQNAIHYMTREASNIIYELDNFGFPFDRKEDGTIHQQAFGSQTLKFGKGDKAQRTCKAGDKTGHSILYTLYGQTLLYDISYFVEYFALDLLMEGRICRGVFAWQLETGFIHRFRAHHTVLATGGAGRCYFSCTGAHSNTGDGLAMVSRAGIPLQDMEFIQFHPTGIYGSGILITEGCRTEGGKLVNSEGHFFMEKYAPNTKDLASRDIVSRAITIEILEGRGVGKNKDHVYLQLNHLPVETIKTKLSGVAHLVRFFAGINCEKEPIPVIPTVHYNMGGIPTNFKGQVLTQENAEDLVVEGLWAAGEVACSSVHGANRLGANGLLEILVFGKAVADNISQILLKGTENPNISDQLGREMFHRFDKLRYSRGRVTIAQLRKDMQILMQKYCGVFRTCPVLQRGCREITKLATCVHADINISDNSLIWNTELVEALELENMMICNLHIMFAAENRRESRGAHARNDYPDRIDEFNYKMPLEGQKRKNIQNHWRKHTLTWALENKSICISYRAVIDVTLDESEANHIPPSIRTD